MRRIVDVLVIVGAIQVGWAQKPESVPKFEAASVKPSPKNRARGGANNGTSDAGRFSRQDVTLFDLILNAYGLERHQLIGPPWLSTERYDITAKVPAGSTQGEQGAMLRNLLAERFGLVVHSDQKQMSVYELVVASGGRKFKKWAPGSPQKGDSESQKDDGPIRFARDADGFPILPPTVGILTTKVNGQWIRTMRGRESMPQFARRLTGEAGRPVIDHTGLTGEYEFMFHWATDAQPVSNPAMGNAESGVLPASGGPSLGGALESQLGLRLLPLKGLIDVLVVDYALRTPTVN